MVDSFSKEFVKAIADELGVHNLDDDTIKCMTDDLSFKTSLLLYQAVKLMHCCKRKRLIPTDVEGAMKLYSVQPTYGFRSKDWIPFRRAGTTSAGRDLIALDDKDLDLDDFVNQEVPKMPTNVSLKAHWLSINGIQPRIPENPQPISEEGTGTADLGAHLAATVPTRVIQDAKSVAFADVTVEQQVYFKEATEACVCADENRRKEALVSLSSDPGLQPLVPRLVAFLSEGVKLNVAQQNYVQLIYLMRMLRSLVENPNLSVETYIHELLPACASCCMSKQLCLRPKEDNHWALRTFAARQLAFLVRKYTTETNQIHSRIVKLAVRVMQDQSSALVSCFGAIAILGELGEEVVRAALLPCVRAFGERVRQSEEASHHQNPLEQMTIKKIVEHIQTVLCPAVKSIMQPPDHMSDYQAKFGYFAHVVLAGVVKERQQHPPPPPQQQQQQQQQQAPMTPYAQQLQQYQQQKQQQRRQSVSNVPVVQTPQQVKMFAAGGATTIKAEHSPTTPIFGAPPLGVSASLPPSRARSPGPAGPGQIPAGLINARIQTITPGRSPAAVTNPAIQQVQQQSTITPSTSPGPGGAQQIINVRIVPPGQQQQQKF